MSGDDSIKRLNYSTDAIPALQHLSASLHEQGLPMSAEAVKTAAERLMCAQKFLLPPQAELLDRNSLKQGTLDLVKLPFPVTAFEYECIKKEGDDLAPMAGVEQAAAPKRISLCWEGTERIEHKGFFRKTVEELEGIFVVSIYSQGSPNEWYVTDGYSFYPYDNQVQVRATGNGYDGIATRALQAAGLVKNTELAFRCEVGIFMPEVFEKRVNMRGRKLALADIALDTHDEVAAMIDACACLACENAETRDIRAPAMINSKRKKKRKVPLFEYKVLDVGGPTPTKGEHLAGQKKTSPRIHLRRAHIRRLKHRNVLVRAAVVNPGSRRGVIAKDYRVSASAKRSLNA